MQGIASKNALTERWRQKRAILAFPVTKQQILLQKYSFLKDVGENTPAGNRQN
jgi:hypothetical protein